MAELLEGLDIYSAGAHDAVLAEKRMRHRTYGNKVHVKVRKAIVREELEKLCRARIERGELPPRPTEQLEKAS